MDRIESKASGVYHALRRAPRRGKEVQGLTYCGKTVTGATGVCIATLIGCKNCKSVMRKEGWRV